MKKKWLVLCCVGMLSAFAMTGCGSSADTTAPAEETEEAAEDADAADAEAEDATEENAAADDAQEEVPAEDAEAAQE